MEVVRRALACASVVALLSVATASPALAWSCGVPPRWEDVVAADGSLGPDSTGAPAIAAYVHEVVASAVPLPPLTSRRNASRLVGVWGDRDAEPYLAVPAQVGGSWLDLLPEACNRAPRQGELLLTLVHDRHPLGVDDRYATTGVGAAEPGSPSGVTLGIAASRYDDIVAVLERELGPGDLAPAPATAEVVVAQLTVWWPHAALAAALASATTILRRRRSGRATTSGPATSGAQRS